MPTSSIFVADVTYENGAAKATIELDLSRSDIVVLGRYGPAIVDFGGTYGDTFIPEERRYLVEDLRVTKTFKEDTPANSRTQAEAWQSAVETAISDEITRVRALATGAPGDDDGTYVDV